MALPVAMAKAGRTAGVALASAGLASVLCALAVGAPQARDWPVQLRVFAEALLCAGVLHHMLVSRSRKLGHYPPRIVAGAGIAVASLAVARAAALPASAADAASVLLGTGHGAAMLATALVLAFDLLTTRSALVRLRASIIALGTLAGLLVSAVIIVAAGGFGDHRAGDAVALHWAGVAVLAVPLSLGWATLRHDVFALGAMLQRAVTCVLIVALVAAMHFAALAGAAWVVSERSWTLTLPVTLSVLNLVLLLVIATTQQRTRKAIDRFCLRSRYDAEQVLLQLSQLLISARATDEVIACTLDVVTHTLSCSWSAVFLHQEGARFRQSGKPKHPETELVLPADIAGRLERGHVVTCDEWEDGAQWRQPASWDRLHVELFVPVLSGGRLFAILAVGARRGAYTVHDVMFLRRLADQLVLAIHNATAFDRLERLNTNLQQQVRERTAAIDVADNELKRSNAELNRSNAELSRSLTELRHAYQQLERSQASLLTADRLATLGRLTAGIAHEMNSPLSAALNSLKVVAELGREYAAAIDDPSIEQADHHAIASEILTTVQSATDWVQKAIGFIRSVKTHRREGSAAAERFSISAVVGETQALLVHRLRVARCHIDFEEQPQHIGVVGNPARLAQVLVNLVGNAIDAYEEAGIADGRITIRAEQIEDRVQLEVHDRAGGIPPHVLPHIFDELFTTKGPGRGTGLGLWIARNIIGESFRGTLDVFTTRGVGTCFTAIFPATPSDIEGVGTAVATSLPVPEAIATQVAAPDPSQQDPLPADTAHFLVDPVIDDACGVLADRLRDTACQLEIETDSEGAALAGDPVQFRRILVDLVGNAIAAYQASGATERRIALCVRRAHSNVTVTVRNWAGGVPLHLLPRIFDNTFGTEDAACEVAQGLWMARSIIEHSFGGILDVLTATGGGTTLLAIFPVDPADEPVQKTGTDDVQLTRSTVEVAPAVASFSG